MGEKMKFAGIHPEFFLGNQWLLHLSMSHLQKTVFYSKTVPVQTVKIAIDFNLNELS